jgi:hypothetical protein
MNGCTSQLVALACHLKGALRSGPGSPFFPNNRSCSRCESVRFLRQRPRSLTLGIRTWSVVGRTPDEWFAWAIKNRFEEVILRHESTDNPHFPDRMSTAFVGGGGIWSLQLRRGDRTEAWFASWLAASKQPMGQGVWRVVYRGVRRARFNSPVEDLSLLAAELSAILSVIEGFASLHDPPAFAKCFRQAQGRLASENPLDTDFLRDLAPAGLLSLTSQRLLAAAYAAWVFGGMGSWNDLGSFEGSAQVEYDTLSQRLFDTLNRVICAATNATLP